MNATRCAAVLIAVLAAVASADERDAVFGQWASTDSIIEVGERNGSLHATIVAVRDPVYREGEEGPVGATRVDMKNPDATLRDRPLVGLNLLSGYEFKKGKWQGSLYDPESGKVYQSQITRGSDGTLQMRGYIGAPMFGRTEEWVPVATCTEDIKNMLTMAKVTSC